MLNKEENKRDTIVDRVFRKSLEEFHMQLISTYSVLMKVSDTDHLGCFREVSLKAGKKTSARDVSATSLPRRL